MFTSRIILAALFLYGIAVPAFADDSCPMSLSRAEEYGRSVVKSDSDATFTEYTGAEAAAIIDGINNEEPKTDWDADRILVIDEKGITYRVAIALADCVLKAFAVPREPWDDLVNKAKDKAGKRA